MPLPFLPFVLGGIAIAAGGYGVKKGIDAYDDNEAARKYIEEAKERLAKSQNAYDGAKRQQENACETLGRIKKEILDNNAQRYMAIANKLSIPTSPEMSFYRDIVERLKNIETSFGEMCSALDSLLGGLAVGAIGGALAGFGAFGAVSLFGVASTGTAIASLSGVAATKATLAFFGGGALAAGGFGVVGGAAVLGGLIVAPVIFVAGLFMAEKAEENKRKAKECRNSAIELSDAMDDVTQCSKQIIENIARACETLKYSDIQWSEYMDKIEAIMSQKGGDIAKWNDSDKGVLKEWQQISQVICDCIRMPIFNDEDSLMQRFRRLSENLQKLAVEFDRKYGK